MSPVGSVNLANPAVQTGRIDGPLPKLPSLPQMPGTTAPAGGFGQMLDGLALAETTPGPLIMVLQFVGFVGAWQHPGTLSPLAAGTLGAAVTTWATFAPCFLWIFLGAPNIERLRGGRLNGHATVRRVRTGGRSHADHGFCPRCSWRNVERPAAARTLDPEGGRKQQRRRHRRRQWTADSSKGWKGCHGTIASYDPMARPSRAHARPSCVSAVMRSDCTSQSAWTASITLTSGSWPDA